jgi:hypothetical protein
MPSTGPLWLLALRYDRPWYVSPPCRSRHSRAFANRNQYACGPEFARTRQPEGLPSATVREMKKALRRSQSGVEFKLPQSSCRDHLQREAVRDLRRTGFLVSVPAYSRFPEKKVDRAHFAPIQRWHLYQIAHPTGPTGLRVLHLQAFIGRLGLAKRLRAMASELQTKAAEHQPCQFRSARQTA